MIPSRGVSAFSKMVTAAIILSYYEFLYCGVIFRSSLFSSRFVLVLTSNLTKFVPKPTISPLNFEMFSSSSIFISSPSFNNQNLSPFFRYVSPMYVFFFSLCFSQSTLAPFKMYPSKFFFSSSFSKFINFLKYSAYSCSLSKFIFIFLSSSLKFSKSPSHQNFDLFLLIFSKFRFSSLFGPPSFREVTPLIYSDFLGLPGPLFWSGGSLPFLGHPGPLFIFSFFLISSSGGASGTSGYQGTGGTNGTGGPNGTGGYHGGGGHQLHPAPLSIAVFVVPSDSSPWSSSASWDLSSGTSSTFGVFSSFFVFFVFLDS